MKTNLIIFIYQMGNVSIKELQKKIQDKNLDCSIGSYPYFNYIKKIIVFYKLEAQISGVIL